MRTTHDREYVSESIRDRTGAGLAESVPPGTSSIPEGIRLEDGLTEDEAVAVALWNNPAFQADLAALGFARADLLRAGMLRNPVLSLLFSTGDKQMEATLAWPIQELWQRPRRVAAAQLDAESVAHSLVQTGLDLVRDTRLAFAEVLRQDELARLDAERALLLERLSETDRRQFVLGEVSALDADAARLDAIRAQDAARRSESDRVAGAERLRTLLGLEDLHRGLLQTDGAADSREGLDDLDRLLEIALAARPDLRAAEVSIEAAGRHLGWERTRVWQLIGVLDANDVDGGDREIGPGLDWEIPFNGNRDNRLRAETELERASWSYVAVRNDIVAEVRQAYARHEAGHASYLDWNERILPWLETSEERTRRALAAGDTSARELLVVRLRLVEARGRRVEVASELRRARAALVRAIGTDPTVGGRPAVASAQVERPESVGASGVTP